MAVRDGVPARDPEAILGARWGDTAAQVALFSAHKQSIARLVHRLTGNAASVDDLVQEVFIAAFMDLERFRGDSTLRTWLYSIALNKVRNYWDSERRRQNREQRAALRPRDPPSTPHDEVESQEHRARLYQALGQLPTRLRDAFTLRALEGLSLQEASQILGVPISTVSHRTRRAEALLCQALGLPERSA